MNLKPLIPLRNIGISRTDAIFYHTLLGLSNLLYSLLDCSHNISYPIRNIPVLMTSSRALSGRFKTRLHNSSMIIKPCGDVQSLSVSGASDLAFGNCGDNRVT